MRPIAGSYLTGPVHKHSDNQPEIAVVAALLLCDLFFDWRLDWTKIMIRRDEIYCGYILIWINKR